MSDEYGSRNINTIQYNLCLQKIQEQVVKFKQLHRRVKMARI